MAEPPIPTKAYQKHAKDKLSDPSNLSARERYKLEQRRRRLEADPAENRRKPPEAETPKANQGETGSVTYGELDSLGRPTGIEATITPDMIGTGTEARSSIYPPGFQGGGPGSAGHARGHLLGRQLGGSGSDVRNLVTLYQNPVNSPVMRDFETSIRKAVERGEVVNYGVTPVYSGDNPIPIGITMQATGTGGFSLHVTVLNRVYGG